MSANKLRDKIKQIILEEVADLGVYEVEGVDPESATVATHAILEAVKSSLPGKVNRHKIARYQHYHGRPCNFLGYETNPYQDGYNTALSEVKKLLEGSDE